MCGIIGALVTDRDAAPLLFDGLRRLEYRGYDSAGIATLDGDGRPTRRRAAGKLDNLQTSLYAAPMKGRSGIGHTRWATHGPANETNAHPHLAGPIAIVHNGIIENEKPLRAELAAEGVTFESDTDTEVIARLLHRELQRGSSPEDAMATVMPRLAGAFAFVCLLAGEDDLMLAARQGTPLALGLGDGEAFCASDALALAPLTRRVVYLEEGDWAVLRRSGAEVRNRAGETVDRPEVVTEVSGALVGKGNFRHFMEKEIHEQDEVIGYTLRGLIDGLGGDIAKPSLPAMPFDPKTLSKITIVACGTASYAGQIGKYWIERLARVPVECDLASEFRYREPVLPEGGMVLAISQSGETLDTTEALRLGAAQGQITAGVVNVPESTIAREARFVIPTKAGPEIGVASTKAFTTQLAALAVFAVALGLERGALTPEAADGHLRSLTEIPAAIRTILHGPVIRRAEAIAHDLVDKHTVLYLGRGTSWTVAMEGALKFKEISYIHAEGYAAGEMKHGPIALIEEGTPVVFVAPEDGLAEKTLSNMRQVRARGGEVILVTDEKGADRFGELAEHVLEVPTVDPLWAPIALTVPVQVLAYETALAKGTDVDQPRNLAKSVTVE
ncbi:MAG: glutamine--fructose-6-phosphate transaminase (isomerizing) [Alphaproteobacteria bacterium]|nr:glutamine--fructose-6-phosphate transaminase (isomerizing) [Alphaproteobacteria bacterium]